MLVFFCAIHLSCFPSVPTSSMPEKNASLCTQGSILRLKSHLHLRAPCAVLPFRRLSDCLICQPCSSLPLAAAQRATDAFIVLLFLALTLLHPARSHLPPAKDAGPQDLSRRAFNHPLLHPSEPLIPSPCHCGMAYAEGWGRAGHRAVVVKMCVLSRARENQRR